MRVTVYGHTGVVGSVLYRYLREAGLDVAGVSLDAETPGADACEWAFLCLPTPTVEGKQDQSALEAVAGRLTAPNVVVRSTVLPGTCDRLAEAHPEWSVYHWPEFLSARSAWRDFCSPRVHVVGGDGATWELTWADVLPYAPTAYTTRATAELVKYAHNVHGAMQVIYANLLYDAAAQAGASFEAVRRIVPDLGYVAPETVGAYWNVWRDGYRGYGGACFPKDTAALLGYMGERGELLEGLERANARLRA